MSLSKPRRMMVWSDGVRVVAEPTSVATPEQIAPFVVYLASDESRVVTGGVFPIDSGYMAFKANVDVMGVMNKLS